MFSLPAWQDKLDVSPVMARRTRRLSKGTDAASPVRFRRAFFDCNIQRAGNCNLPFSLGEREIGNPSARCCGRGYREAGVLQNALALRQGSPVRVIYLGLPGAGLPTVRTAP